MLHRTKALPSFSKGLKKNRSYEIFSLFAKLFTEPPALLFQTWDEKVRREVSSVRPEVDAVAVACLLSLALVLVPAG